VNDLLMEFIREISSRFHLSNEFKILESKEWLNSMFYKVAISIPSDKNIEIKLSDLLKFYLGYDTIVCEAIRVEDNNVYLIFRFSIHNIG